MVFHVMNRAVRRAVLFKTTADYDAFFRVLREAVARLPMRILAMCVMPNHWHLVLWPEGDTDLTRFVGWLSLTHACRWQRVHGTRGTGPVYQNRFKAIPVETGHHLLMVLRYVERNAVRARLVPRAEDWPWCSASLLTGTDMPTMHDWPIPRPPNWLDLVNEPEPTSGLQAIRKAVGTSGPFGSDRWRDETIKRLGWRYGVRPVGHPLGRPRMTDSQTSHSSARATKPVHGAGRIFHSGTPIALAQSDPD